MEQDLCASPGKKSVGKLESLGRVGKGIASLGEKSVGKLPNLLTGYLRDSDLGVYELLKETHS